MTVDEPGHYNAARGIDLLGVARLGEIFHTASGPYLHEYAVADQE
jgi:hypothetical protein